MNNYSFVTTESKNEALEKYLNDELINYGVAESGGHRPKYIYCGIKDTQKNYIGGIKGYAMLDFFISQLFVDKHHRNTGLGRELVSKIESVAKDHGCNVIRLDTLNKQSHDFYLKSGFENTVTIKEYMKGFDLLFFHKHISQNT